MKLKALALGVMMAGCGHAADLLDVYEMAITSDPALLGARASFDSRREVRSQAFSRFLPQLSGSVARTDGQTDVNIANIGTVDVPDTDTENISLDLTQSVFDYRNYARYGQAKHQVAEAEANYEQAFEAFALRVAERYFAVLTAQDVLTFARAEETAVNRQLDHSEQRFEVGLTAITDVLESRARYDAATARVIVAENQLSDAREALRELTGQDVGELAPLEEEIPLEIPAPQDLEAWVEIALTNDPTIEARAQAVAAAEDNIRALRADRYPSVSLIAGYNENTNNALAQRDDFGRVIGLTTQVVEGTSATLRLSVPIYEGGAISSRNRQAAADHELAVQRLEEQRRAVIRATRNAYRDVQASILEVRARDQAFVSAQSALEATQAGFDVGTRTIVDVLLSQQQLFQAQGDLSRARHNYVLNRLRLKEAAGVLGRDDIATVNRFLK